MGLLLSHAFENFSGNVPFPRSDSSQTFIVVDKKVGSPEEAQLEFVETLLNVIDAYNETRWTVNKEIAQIHINTVDYVGSLTKSLNQHDHEQFVPTKILVESIFRKALVRIASLEGKKCSRLSNMIKCITPALEKQCGLTSAEALKISLLVGYLKQERKDELESHFEGFGGEDDPLCTALHKYI
ncbi:hypothetical protein L596_003434 [Steinernema carpocapsae]|uniref:Uncharacterized protein n=1 Tax=Steinernema carpocapsae TaxID=34508 RepID=A0A4U8USP3_STECR|nr:hypothetical protein L596_003434 [Steinernema carpocapsae]